MEIQYSNGLCWACGRAEAQESLPEAHHSWCRGLWMQETARERELSVLIRQQEIDMRRRTYDPERYYDPIVYRETGRRSMSVYSLSEMDLDHGKDGLWEAS